ncbi:tyrosine-protein kinase receptor torso [Microplitis demolitor]|uniref:tyrosine-protein kinase receptor torso n=1 Tax=Microplitis demolitor TaxID=69319 RepID=UPI0004CD91ED|nr:tyrosine-protein kinase receptor torso [Microplitis demolitor]
MIYFIIFYLFIGTFGETFDRAIQIAECIVNCNTDSCQNDCYKNIYPQREIKKIDLNANFNATLHCRDVNFLSILHNPGLFVIEQSAANRIWNNAQVINGKISLFSNLYPGSNYRYRTHRVTGDGISQPEISSWFTTMKLDSEPEQVKEIFVNNTLPERMNSKYLQAEVIFKPAEDLSCFYEVLSWTRDGGLSIGNINATKSFKFYLHGLDYNQNNTLIISAKNEGFSLSSKNLTYSFITPTCLDVHQNLTICPPNAVDGLNVSQIYYYNEKCNFTISWDKPDLIPDNYTIQIFTFDKSDEPQLIVVPGELTEVIVSINKTGIRYMISIIAESHGGTSPPVSIFRTFDRMKNNSISVFKEVAIVSPIIILIITLIATILLYLRHRKNKEIQRQNNYCSNLKETINLNPLYKKYLKPTSMTDNKIDNDSLLTNDNFEIRPVQLQIKDILGSGISGVVRLGLLKIDQHRSIKVAVKMLKDCSSSEEIRNFHQEILIMKSAGIHPNIVSLIGCCTSNIRPMLVVEYCSRGDLQSFLRDKWEKILSESCKNKTHDKSSNNACQNPNYFSLSKGENATSNQLYDVQQGLLDKNEELTVENLLSFAQQVANGMEYLSLNRIVHRDLAARNVLVCDELTVKISDFGLSRDVYRENVYKKEGSGKLPLKWMAIEALTHQIYTTQSDVWSFGILLWEIVTLGCNPYPEIPTNMLLHFLKSGYRMPKPSNCSQELYDIMIACWNSSPRNRPTFTELKNSLDKLMPTITDKHEYININDLIQVPNKREILE